MIPASRPKPWRGGPGLRSRRAIRPAAEPLEDRAVPAGSITAAFDGLTAPVASVTLPQPPSNGEQTVSLTLGSSSAIPTLFKDNVSGKLFKSVAITLDQIGNTSTDTITLTTAILTSFRTVSSPTAAAPTFVVTVEGKATPPGSIAASFGGLTAPVVNATLTPPTAGGLQSVALTLAASSAIPKLFQESASGKPINPVLVTLLDDGNSVTDTIALTDTLITSIQTVGGATDVPTFVVTVEGRAPTPPPTVSASANFDGLSPPVLGVVLAPPSSGTQQATVTLGLSAQDLPLILDAILGRPIKAVTIVQTQSDGGTVTTALTNVRISSVRLVAAPSGGFSLVLTLVGHVATTGPT